MGRLIGIAGAAGAGKDTAAQVLVAEGWVRESFADRMRQAILALDPWVDSPRGYFRLSLGVEALGWDAAKRDYPEIRRLLQKFGTEAGRDIHGTDCWVDLVLTPWLRAAEQPDLVITDVRFENEARAVREAGGAIVQIRRPGLAAIAGGHPSEAGFPQDLISWVVYNDGDVEYLHDQMRELAGMVGNAATGWWDR